MEYFALHYFGDGAMRRHPETFDPKVTPLGEFDTIDEAIKQACAQLNCNHLTRGVLSYKGGKAGYIVLNAQELTTV